MTKKHEIRIELNRMALPPDNAKRLESGIRQAIMNELAKIDTEGDVAIKNLLQDAVVVIRGHMGFVRKENEPEKNLDVTKNDRK